MSVLSVLMGGTPVSVLPRVLIEECNDGVVETVSSFDVDRMSALQVDGVQLWIEGAEFCYVGLK